MKVVIALFVLIASCFVTTAMADVTYKTEKVSEFDIPVVRMTVTPAAEPVPALRYRLVARDIDLKAGNAVPYYHRAIADLQPELKRLREKFAEDTQLEKWYATGEEATPIAKLPLDKVREASQVIDRVYREHLVHAFTRRGCDWELGVDEIRGVEIISFLLPEFQESRNLGRMLALRTRLAIAEHRYAAAAEDMQHQYRLGSDVAKVPFLVCGLIGIAIDGIANGTMIELIANPGSPNMYWAIAQLPQPPIDLQPAARFELDIGARIFAFIDHAETTEHAPQEWNRLYTQALSELGGLAGQIERQGSGEQPKSLEEARAGIAATGLALVGYSHAKEWLISQGMNHDRVEKMAVGQVIAIYSERVCRQFADEFETLWYLPFEQMQNRERSITKTLDEMSVLGTGKSREILPIVSLLMPAMQSVRGAQVRLERDVAALRVIEALRMYAADHNRQLPKSLDEIMAVPVPLNPATGKPFVYRLDGKTAVLELPPSDHIPGSYRRYEIQIAEK